MTHPGVTGGWFGSAEPELCEYCHGSKLCNCARCKVTHRSTSDNPVSIAGECQHCKKQPSHLPKIYYYIGSRQSGRSTKIVKDACIGAVGNGHRTVVITETVKHIENLIRKAEAIGATKVSETSIRVGSRIVDFISCRSEKFSQEYFQQHPVDAMLFDDVKPPLWVGFLPLKVLVCSIYLSGVGFSNCEISMLPVPEEERLKLVEHMSFLAL